VTEGLKPGGLKPQVPTTITPTDNTKPFIDPEIEAALLAGIMQQKEEVINSGLVLALQESQFAVPAYQWLVEKFIGKGKIPVKPVLNQALHEQVENVDEREKIQVALYRLYELDTSWLKDAIDTFRKFLTFQSTSIAVRKFYEDYGRTRNVELSLRELNTGLSNAARLLDPQGVRVVDYAREYAIREKDRRFKRDNPDLHPVLRMGVSKFDQQIKMKAGTVTNFLAPMKRYKSVILASLAFAGLLQGFNVVFVVVENTIELTLDRLDAMFTQINYERVVNSLLTAEERKVVDELFSKLNSWPQRLKVIKGEPHQIGTSEVKRELKRLQKDEGFNADVGIFDYLNILKPSSGGSADDWLGQTQLVWDLQQMAKAPGEEMILVTATQANMAGAEVDKEGKPIKLRQHHQGRSLGIAQAVDATIAIDIEVTGKPEDQMASPPQIILSPLYLRDGFIIYPEVRLVSEIDKMCLDREQRKLWEEAEDGFGIIENSGVINKVSNA
jgi:hypothetical protein